VNHQLENIAPLIEEIGLMLNMKTDQHAPVFIAKMNIYQNAAANFGWINGQPKMQTVYVYYWIKKNFLWSNSGDDAWGLVKYNRFVSGPGPVPNAYYQLGQTTGRRIEFGVSPDTGFLWDYNALFSSGVWHCSETMYSMANDTTGSMEFTFDGQIVNHDTGLNFNSSAMEGFGIGLARVRNGSLLSSDRYWLDDIYIDNTQARVMIGNNQNFSLCTHLEIQIPHTTWNDTAIQFTANLGSFNSTEQLYLFVVDENGNASEGFALARESVPTIASVSGPLAHGQNITITGIGFGVKNPVEPYKYDSFDRGADAIGANIDTVPSDGAIWQMWSSCPDEGWALPGEETRFSTAFQRFSGDVSAWKYFGFNAQHNCFQGSNHLYLENLDGFDKVYWSMWILSTSNGEYAKMRNVKIANWGNSVGDGAGVPEGRWDFYPVNGYTNGHVYVGSCSGVPFNGWGVGYSDFKLGSQTWNRFEGLLRAGDVGVANGGYAVWRDNAILQDSGNVIVRNTASCQKPDTFRFTHYFDDLDTQYDPPTPNINYYHSEIYVDTTPARIEICNEIQKDQAGHCEIQIPHNIWNDGNIQFTANLGAFKSTDSLFLFVIDADGNVNQEGYSLTTADLPSSFCGNDKTNYGEECDGSDLNNFSCSRLGFDEGILGCYESGSADECIFDTQHCTPTNAIIVDNLDIDHVREYGGGDIWPVPYSAQAFGRVYTTYIVGYNFGWWTRLYWFELFSPLTPGRYDAQVRWITRNPASNVTAEYVVRHANGNTSFNVSQQTGEGQWNSLGIFNFSNEGSIRLLHGIVEDRTIDAIRFVPIMGNSTCPSHDADDDSMISAGEIRTALSDWLSGTLNMQNLMNLMSYFKRGTCT
jgi:hypothetical protein